MQLLPYITNPNEYALNKDLDVVLWLRTCGDRCCGLCNYLHDQFDQFKRTEVRLNYELLWFYSLSKLPNILVKNKVMKFGNTYLELHTSDMNLLIEWTLEVRNLYQFDGEEIFKPEVKPKSTVNFTGNYMFRMQWIWN